MSALGLKGESLGNGVQTAGSAKDIAVWEVAIVDVDKKLIGTLLYDSNGGCSFMPKSGVDR